MSKRGQMFSCLTTAIAGFVLLCPVLSGRAFGDFQLVVDFKIGFIYGADQAGSTGNIDYAAATVSAQSALDAVASGNTSMRGSPGGMEQRRFVADADSDDTGSDCSQCVGHGGHRISKAARRKVSVRLLSLSVPASSKGIKTDSPWQRNYSG